MNPYTYKISLRIRRPASSLEQTHNALSLIPGIKIGYLKDIGTPRKDPKGNLLVGEYTSSLFSVCFVDHWQRSDTISLEDALNEFVDRISSSRDLLLDIHNTGGSIDFFIGIKINNNSGFNLGTALMKRLAELNVELGLDLYSSGDK